TGLGRAPLPREAASAAAEVARGYADLEVERDTGARGRRTDRAEVLLQVLTGAQDALVVNNNAAALLLALAALAPAKDVLVSRGTSCWAARRAGSWLAGPTWSNGCGASPGPGPYGWTR